MAKHYGKPRHDIVIEPFAGGACYSLYWNCRVVKLYDLDEDLCSIWDYLIHCSESDIARLPDYIEDVAQLQILTRPEALLISRWLYASPTVGVVTNSNLGFYKRKIAAGFKWLWSTHVKERIIRQKPLIADWTIMHCSYQEVPNIEAHWFIDPPYRNLKTTKYKYGRSNIDYSELSEWCRSRKGAVDVCEKQIENVEGYLPFLEPTHYLPFKDLHKHTDQHGNIYTEMLWSKP